MSAYARTMPGLAQLLGVAAFAALAGCNSVDTPRRLQPAYYFNHKSPLEVLQETNDGNKRAEAFGDMAEPIRNGGDREQQEVYIKVLTAAAQSDPEPLCRLRAIRTLGKYKDPRAVACLEQVCQEQPRLPAPAGTPPGTFTPEMNSLIHQEALVSLQETGDPAARRMLLLVARGPSAPLEASVADRSQTLDERLAAVRGLGKFKQYDAIETLVHVMETERDVALRQCAYQSLREATGKDLPPDPTAWRGLLRDPGVVPAAGPTPSLIERVGGVFSKK